VGYTYDGTTIKLYVNGKLDGSYNVPNLAVPEDYVQIFGWSLTGYPGVYGGYNLLGEIADARMYDHTLSVKEIKELAKGLMIQYNFKEYIPYYSYSYNYFQYPTPQGAIANSYAWDPTLHRHAIAVSGWSTGHNGGVTPAPESGFHAHWQLINDIPTMVFPKLNHKVAEVNSASRWLGISTSTPTSGGSFAAEFPQGDSYVISFEAMADSPGREVYAGYYYNGTFPDGYVYASDIPVGTWKKYTFRKEVSKAITSGGAFYFYGHSGENGTAYVRNVQLSHYPGDCLHYLPKTMPAYNDNGVGRLRAVTLSDCSGFGHEGNLIGSPSAVYAIQNDINLAEGSQISFYSGGAYASTDLIAIPDSYTLIWDHISIHPAGHYVDWRAKSGEAGVQPFYFNGSQIQYYSSAGGTVYFDYDFSQRHWDKAIAIVVTASTATLYVDGVKQQTISATNPAGTRANFNVFARCSGTNIVATDTSGSLRVYATALSDADILADYQKGAYLDKKYNLYTGHFKEE
jgi:hypothetical protein